MKKILIGSLFLVIFSFCFPEEKELRPYRLINADTLIVNKIQNEYVSDLIGNVHFFYGDTEFFTDKAKLYEKQKITHMYGNVEVYDDTLSLFADEVEYHRITEKLYLYGNVFVKEVHRDSTIRTFKAQQVEYFRNEKEFYAKNNVKVYDEREELHGSCGQLNYYINNGYGYLMKNPIMILATRDSLTLSAEKIEYFENFKKVVANFNVKTELKDFYITSDFLLYFSEQGKAIYLGEPKFFSDFANADAKEFQIYFENEKIKNAHLEDSCRVDFRTEEQIEKLNWVTSDFMDFIFEKGKITIYEAEQNVNSFFKQEETEKKDFSVNNATGEKLIVKIKDNEIESITMKHRVKGKYKFKKE